MPSMPLDAIHADLRRSGITPAEARAMKIKATEDGYRIPYFDIAGKPTGFFRERILRADGFRAMQEKPQKYRQPAGTGTSLYFSSCVDMGKAIAAKDTVFVFCEGEKKAHRGNLQCVREGRGDIVFIGTGGVSAWGDGAGSLLPAFTLLKLDERDVYICSLQSMPDGSKVGIDDYFEQGKTLADFEREILEKATSYRGAEELLQLNTEVVYIRDPGFVYCFEDHLKVAPADFINHTYANRKYTIPDADDPKKTKTFKTAKSWIEWEQRSELRGMTFAPGQPTITKDLKLNTWTGLAVEPVEGDIKPWYGLLIHLMGEAKGAGRYFEQWCAYPLQKLGTKMAVASVFWGVVHGSGKTLLGQTLMMLYGKHGVELKDAHIRSDRNEWAEDAQFALVDDITGHDNRKLANHFKTMVTQKYVRIDIKYVKSFSIPDCCNFFFTSNDPDAFFLDDGDRRFFIWEVLAGKLPEDLRRRFLQWRDKENGLAHLLWHLQHLDLEGFDPMSEAMMTGAKSDMISMAKSDLAYRVSKFINDPISSGANGHAKAELFTSEEVKPIIDPLETARISPNGVARELKRQGCIQLPQVKLSNGRWVRLWAVHNREPWKTASPKKIVEHYERLHPDIVIPDRKLHDQ
jgi:hypothetical protein